MELPYDAVEYYVVGDDDVLHGLRCVQTCPGLGRGSSNGWMSTTFQRPPTWQYNDLDDNRIIVWTKTNNAPGKRPWRIRRADGLYWAGATAEPNTTYRDTLVLNQGCYRSTCLTAATTD